MIIAYAASAQDSDLRSVTPMADAAFEADQYLLVVVTLASMQPVLPVVGLQGVGLCKRQCSTQ
jgi:hypothetical protein